MKKILALVLACVFMLGMTVQVFGAETSASKDVYLKVIKSDTIIDSGERNNEVIGFEIEWTADNIVISVTETIEQGKKWNPDEKTYEWDEATKKATYSGYSEPFAATVRNISAVPVTVSVDFEYAEGIERKGWVDYYIVGNETLDAYDEGTKTGGEANINFVIMAGEAGVAEQIAELVGENGTIKLGTITISISAAE